MESKLYLKTKRVKINLTESIDVLTKIFLKLGCSNEVSQEVSIHLSDANLCGMESHGIMRVLQYAEQFQSGYMNPKAKPKIFLDKKGIKRVSGNEGIGIPVMKIAYMPGINDAKTNGISALSIRDVGHTFGMELLQISPLKRGYYQFALGAAIDKLGGKLLHMEG